jgi:hypothetical protein
MSLEGRLRRTTKKNLENLNAEVLIQELYAVLANPLLGENENFEKQTLEINKTFDLTGRDSFLLELSCYDFSAAKKVICTYFKDFIPYLPELLLPENPRELPLDAMRAVSYLQYSSQN